MATIEVCDRCRCASRAAKNRTITIASPPDAESVKTAFLCLKCVERVHAAVERAMSPPKKRKASNANS